MKIIKCPIWTRYKAEPLIILDPDKTGKWIINFSDTNWADNLCQKAINENIVSSCKYKNRINGVICFYLHFDDKEQHKKILQWFINNNMIRKTKTGKLVNISFKLDSQTRNGEYGKDFKPIFTLSDFVDLHNGIVYG